ncbi:MAG: DUF434 domain-containing protein [Palaeococcus sp.]|uniref:DUF434 domain-containing protein n=1 Tax=Palaeococcus sp. (in: euryarchaeotes) TaxID=2820298 RepID=UPI0026000547|nr:DUF434 domain-containing protein [Palaeococcus sp. (in: euryarchaeotes)]MCD6558485.1 DUF434 domain-containing protein [Palaeococcus sp. (in: euryarchaeotes)]
MSPLFLAYEDLKYLLNRGYKKKSALDFVANHYTLTLKERHFLARCVFSDSEIEERKKKLLKKEEIEGSVLGIDGFNVLITLESLLEGRAILCEDGLLRDLERRGGYTLNVQTPKNLELLLGFLKLLRPSGVWFLYDAPVSKSGQVVRITWELMEKFGLSGGARLSKAPDHDLKDFEVVASSDIGIIKKVPFIVDLPCMIGEEKGIKYPSFLDVLKKPQLLGF